MTRKTLIFIVSLGIAGALFAGVPSDLKTVAPADATEAVTAIHDSAGSINLVAW